MWKKSENRINKPYSVNDDFDYFIIFFSDKKYYLLLSKDILIEKNIISSEFSSGKLGMRIYMNDEKLFSKQAKEA